MRSRPPERRLGIQGALCRLRSQVVPVLSGAWLLGCASRALNVGSNDAGTLDVEEAPTRVDFDASATTQVWIGHLVNQQFPDGSNALTMTLDSVDAGSVTGTFLLGSGALLEPPTDPNVGYPPGVVFSYGLGGPPLVEGFLYTILNGSWTGSQLTFQFDEFQVWTQWCAIQTSYLVQLGNDSGAPGVVATNQYSCLPRSDGGAFEIAPSGCFTSSNSSAMSPIDCGKVELCTGPAPCQCSAGGCQVISGPAASVGLTATDTHADGTLSGSTDTYEVQFVRVQ
jgi:hypothetical protein